VKRRLGGPWLVLAATGFLVSCGGSAPAGSPGAGASTSAAVVGSLPPGGACSLIPDIAVVIGRAPIAAPNGYTVGATQRCMWVMSRDPSRYVGLSLGSDANHGATIDALGDGEAVEGLGDDARWWAASRMLSVATGDLSLQVDLQLDPAEATKDLAVELARRATESLSAGGD
jgi:hypothetical protein